METYVCILNPFSKTEMVQVVGMAYGRLFIIVYTMASHGIDLVIMEYSSCSIPEVKTHHLSSDNEKLLLLIPLNNAALPKKCLWKPMISAETWKVILHLCHHCGHWMPTALISAATLITKFLSCIFRYQYLSLCLKCVWYNSSHYQCGLSVELLACPHGREGISFTGW